MNEPAPSTLGAYIGLESNSTAATTSSSAAESSAEMKLETTLSAPPPPRVDTPTASSHSVNAGATPHPELRPSSLASLSSPSGPASPAAQTSDIGGALVHQILMSLTVPQMRCLCAEVFPAHLTTRAPVSLHHIHAAGRQTITRQVASPARDRTEPRGGS